MRIYISASFAARDRLRPMRDRLLALNYDVTSSWLNEVSRPPNMSEEIFHKKLALQDLVEATSADLMIQDTLTDSTTGGLHVEWGLGLGRFQRQLLWLVGPYKNLFHRLADEQFDSWEDLLEWLDPKVEWHPTLVMAETDWLERSEGSND